MKKRHLINLFLSGLITTQIVTVSDMVNASVVHITEGKEVLMAQNTNVLTQEQMAEILSSIEQAEKGEDLATLASFLSPYILSTITIESGNTTVITSLKGRKEHEFYLTESFKRVKEREYINSYASTKITEDGQMASVTRIRATNLTTEEGEKYLSVSTDKIHFALIDNQPKIINIESKGWLEQQL
ncbi:hypothetical protein ACN4EE_12100 [Geminocystis sp. CENA526]|uniref:hypothetical protein n=1 Tax=Geminocystis sp. CENA526 TaxID=1355871 RepID=UPI003D6FC02A